MLLLDRRGSWCGACGGSVSSGQGGGGGSEDGGVGEGVYEGAVVDGTVLVTLLLHPSPALGCC